MSLIHQIAGTTIHGLNDIGITCITNAEYGCIDRIETIKNVVDKYVSNGKIVFFGDLSEALYDVAGIQSPVNERGVNVPIARTICNNSAHPMLFLPIDWILLPDRYAPSSLSEKILIHECAHAKFHQLGVGFSEVMSGIDNRYYFSAANMVDEFIAEKFAFSQSSYGHTDQDMQAVIDNINNYIGYCQDFNVIDTLAELQYFETYKAIFTSFAFFYAYAQKYEQTQAYKLMDILKRDSDIWVSLLRECESVLRKYSLATLNKQEIIKDISTLAPSIKCTSKIFCPYL